MQPEIKKLFGVPVYLTSLDRDFSLEEWEEVNKYHKLNNKRYSDSSQNVNFVSKDSYILNNPKFLELKNNLNTLINDYFNKIINPLDPTIKPYITQSWLNYIYEGGFHDLHSHPNSLISGILYFKCSPEKDGIHFYDTVPDQFRIPPKVYSEYNSCEWFFNIAPKKLILFPSKTRHAVKIVKDNNLRISLAFNVFIKGNLGSSDTLTELIL